MVLSKGHAPNNSSSVQPTSETASKSARDKRIRCIEVFLQLDLASRQSGAPSGNGSSDRFWPRNQPSGAGLFGQIGHNGAWRNGQNVQLNLAAARTQAGYGVAVRNSLSLLAVLAASTAGALDLPPAFPETPVTCTWQGVFPGSGISGRWSYITAGEGQYSVSLESPEQLTGILAERVDLEARGLQVLRWTLTGQEASPSGKDTSFERLDVVLAPQEGKPAGPELRLVTTVRTESVCEGRPRLARLGSRWRCRDQVEDSWTLEQGGEVLDSGTRRGTLETGWLYARNEQVNTPDGERSAAVLEASEADMVVERRWLDLQVPWCPLRVDRIRLDRIVGSDILVTRTGVSSEPSKPPTAPDQPKNRWVWWLLFCVFSIAGLIITQVIHRTARKGL
jgi:hypothetical protein